MEEIKDWSLLDNDLIKLRKIINREIINPRLILLAETDVQHNYDFTDFSIGTEEEIAEFNFIYDMKEIKTDENEKGRIYTINFKFSFIQYQIIDLVNEWNETKFNDIILNSNDEAMKGFINFKQKVLSAREEINKYNTVINGYICLYKDNRYPFDKVKEIVNARNIKNTYIHRLRIMNELNDYMGDLIEKFKSDLNIVDYESNE